MPNPIKSHCLRCGSLNPPAHCRGGRPRQERHGSGNRQSRHAGRCSSRHCRGLASRLRRDSNSSTRRMQSGGANAVSCSNVQRAGQPAPKPYQTVECVREGRVPNEWASARLTSQHLNAAPEKRQWRPRLHVWRTAPQPGTTVLTWRNIVNGNATNMSRLPGPSAVLADLPSRRTASVRSLTFCPSPRCNSYTPARPGLRRLFPYQAQRHSRDPATQSPLVRAGRSRQRSSATPPTKRWSSWMGAQGFARRPF